MTFPLLAEPNVKNEPFFFSRKQVTLQSAKINLTKTWVIGVDLLAATQNANWK